MTESQPNSTNKVSTNPNDSPSVDYSKRKGVVVADLTLKAISTIALVVIGYVSYQFQTSTEDTKQKSQVREQQEQIYLPIFRSISEVDFALEEISTEFGWPTLTEEEAERENRIGTRLSYLAESLYFPASDKDKFPWPQPTVKIWKALNNANGKSERDGSHLLELPVQDAVRLLAEFMRVEPKLHEMQAKKNMMVRIGKGSLCFEDGSEKYSQDDECKNTDRFGDDEVPLAQHSIKSFEQWLPSRMTVDDLYQHLDITTMGDDISGELSVVTKDIIMAHPEMADKYVIIRADVIREREQLLATK